MKNFFKNLGNRYTKNDDVISQEAVISQEFDEIKTESANGISRISVDSDIDIVLSKSDTNNIVAQLSGENVKDSGIIFSVDRNSSGNKLKISAKFEKKLIQNANSVIQCDSSSSVIINGNVISQGNGNNRISIINSDGIIISNNTTNKSQFVLEIKLPQKEFDEFSVECSRDIDITVANTIKANFISIITFFGNIRIISDIDANDVLIRNNHGNIVLLAKIDAQTIRIENKMGSIKLRGSILASKLKLMSKHGDIEAGNAINSNIITIENNMGNVNVSSEFSKLEIHCSHGNIFLETEAQHDISVDLSSSLGNIQAIFKNIASSRLQTYTSLGKCTNTLSYNGKHILTGSISTSHGNILIK